MSVFVTLRIKADADMLEAWAAENRGSTSGTFEQAKRYGAVAHRFYANDSGDVVVVHEWPDADSFKAFFGEYQGEIEAVMAARGAQGKPEVNIWRELLTDVNDSRGS